MRLDPCPRLWERSHHASLRTAATGCQVATVWTDVSDAAAAPPTIMDIAAHAGVSKTTVSRALNGSPRVAPATRARVQDAVLQLGFQVNQAARSLRTSRTGLVGFLVPVISIFGLIVEALDEHLAEHGLGILVTSSRRRDAARDIDAVETLVGRGVDALVLAPSDDRSPELARYLRTLNTPIVL